ncbi:hypothetical protein ACFE04_023425 [Oxalis oulophora]
MATSRVVLFMLFTSFFMASTMSQPQTKPDLSTSAVAKPPALAAAPVPTQSTQKPSTMSPASAPAVTKPSPPPAVTPVASVPAISKPALAPAMSPLPAAASPPSISTPSTTTSPAPEPSANVAVSNKGVVSGSMAVGLLALAFIV